MDKQTLLERITDYARELGFLACGIVPANHLGEEEDRLNRWLGEGMHGTMTWMERNREKRLDPRLLMEGAKTVIVVLQNYHTLRKQEDPSAPVVSQYAFGRDYHPVMKAKLKELLRFIRQEVTPCVGRAFVDSAPVLERAWAHRAGLGWIGKNSLLISPEYGSFFFIGVLLIDAEIPFDKSDAEIELKLPVTELMQAPNSSGTMSSCSIKPKQSQLGKRSREFTTELPDRCGTCSRCIDACPTNAIVAPRVVDARRCISYLTIEHKGEIDPEFRGKLSNRVFGCDICQDVCPWNRKASEHEEPQFRPSSSLLKLSGEEWHALDEKNFREFFTESAISRTGFEGIRRNLRWI